MLVLVLVATQLLSIHYVTDDLVQVLAIVPKSAADAWLAKQGENDETSGSV